MLVNRDTSQPYYEYCILYNVLYSNLIVTAMGMSYNSLSIKVEGLTFSYYIAITHNKAVSVGEVQTLT